MKSPRHLFVAAAALVAALGLLVGCGSGADGKTGATFDNGGSLSGAPIVVGSVCSCTGAQAASLGAADDMMKAWASEVNANGGINGHPLKLIVKDDAGDPAKALQAVKELVEKDHVIAIVGDTSNVDVSWASYVEEKGIPVVGGLPLNLPFMVNADFYPSGGSALAFTFGVISGGKESGGKLAVLYCAESPQCASGIALDKALGPHVGVEIVYDAKVAGTATDYTSQCLGAKKAGATAMWVAAGTSVVKRVVDNCVQQGVQLVQVAGDGSISPKWPEDKAFDGAQIVQLTAPSFDESIPATKQYRAALAKYLPGTVGGEQDGAAGMHSWVAGKLFEAAAAKAKLGDDATSEDVKAGLYALKDETLGGLTAPITYTKGMATLMNCYFTVGIEQGKYTTPDGLKPTCAPLELLQPIADQIAGSGH